MAVATVGACTTSGTAAEGVSVTVSDTAEIALVTISCSSHNDLVALVVRDESDVQRLRVFFVNGTERRAVTIDRTQARPMSFQNRSAPSRPMYSGSLLCSWIASSSPAPQRSRNSFGYADRNTRYRRSDLGR
jgi:hypothetical protein